MGGLCAASVLLSLALEWLHLADGGALFEWLSEHPLSAAANATVAVLVGLTFLAFTGRGLLAFGLQTALLGTMGLVHSTKLAVLGKPLFPWDVFLHREALAFVPELASGAATVASVLVLVGLGLAVRYERRALEWKARSGLAAGLVCVALLVGPRPHELLKPWGVVHRKWEQTENYRQNGLLLAFAFNLNNVAVSQPEGYGPTAVRSAIAPKGPSTALGKNGGQVGPSTPLGKNGAVRSPRAESRGAPPPPTVIAVMSESFFDPTRLPGVSFSEDPVPNLHRLQKEASSGTLFPPSFGGGTANTEFEFLTGHSMHFLPTGSVPYQQYVRRKQASLASIFAARGYRTAAVHTNFRWFWEREQVYQHFGFQRFVSSEDMPEAPLDGKWISDAVLTDYVVREVEKDPTPLFLFGISMEAHGPYDPGRYPASTLRIDGPLDDTARAELMSFVESARHADRELGALVETFQRSERPLFLIFFGDHLPSLPHTFRQTGVAQSIDRLTREQKHFLHQVPLVVWTNTGAPRRDLGALSASFLGPLVLELTGTPGTAYTRFLQGVAKQMPIVMQGLVSDANGVLSDEPPARLKGLDDDWWLLEYDALFGAGYQADDSAT